MEKNREKNGTQSAGEQGEEVAPEINERSVCVREEVKKTSEKIESMESQVIVMTPQLSFKFISFFFRQFS